MRNRPQGTTLAPRGPVTSGQSCATARLAGRHVAGVARVAPANGVASWQQRPGPGSRHQGQATGWTASGLVKHTSHSLTPGAHSWPDAMTWLPARRCYQCLPPQAPACPRKASHRGPGDQADHHQGPKGMRGVRRSPEQAAHRRGSLGQMLPRDTVTRCTDLKDFFLFMLSKPVRPLYRATKPQHKLHEGKDHVQPGVGAQSTSVKHTDDQTERLPKLVLGGPFPGVSGCEVSVRPPGALPTPPHHGEPPGAGLSAPGHLWNPGSKRVLRKCGVGTQAFQPPPLPSPPGL